MKTNLINPELFDYAFPWGNYCNKTAINMEKNVHWFPNNIVFDTIREFQRGWTMDANWQRVEVTSNYTVGLIVSKQQYGFGTYHVKCQLPQFRGDWSAPLWFYDIIPPPSGIQCEMDFERFVKDSCLSKYHLTCTYHDGDRKDIMGTKNQWVPMKTAELKFVWQPDLIQWWVNGKMTLEVRKSDVIQFPTKPMNIIVNSGIGNWNIQDDKLEPLVITEFHVEL